MNVGQLNLAPRKIKKVLKTKTFPMYLFHYLATDHLGAAVSIMNGDGGLQGVVRLLQAEQDLCIVDGTLDGLPPGQHVLFVHQLGDISNGCDR